MATLRNFRRTAFATRAPFHFFLVGAAAAGLSACIEAPDHWDSDVMAQPPTVAPPAEPVAPSYVPDALFADTCSAAAQFEDPGLAAGSYPDDAGSYPDADAARAALAGTWVRCLDRAGPDGAGVQILPDGSWRDLSLQDGELVAGSGFDHEGYLRLLDASRPDSPGLFQVDVLPHGLDTGSAPATIPKSSTWVSEGALVFRIYEKPFDAAVYLRTELPVRVPAPEYAEGERAGVAACATGEQGIVATTTELESVLSGDFVVCSGALSDAEVGLRFEGTKLSVLDAAGEPVATSDYELLGNDGDLRLRVVPRSTEHQWQLFVSRQPLKIWIREDAGNDSIFSALP